MQEKVAAIIDILKDRYPQALCALHYKTDYQLIIAVRKKRIDSAYQTINRR